MLETLGHLPIGWLLIAPLAAAGFFAFYSGRTQIGALTTGSSISARLHSQPNYHGYFLTFCTILPAALIFIVYLLFVESHARGTLIGELPAYLTDRGDVEVSFFVDRVSEHARQRTSALPGNLLFDASVERFAIIKGGARALAFGLALLVGALGFRW